MGELKMLEKLKGSVDPDVFARETNRLCQALAALNTKTDATKSS